MREVLVFQYSGILNNSDDTDSLRLVGLLLKSSLTWTGNCWNFPIDKHGTYGIKVTDLGPQLILFLTLQVIYVFTFFFLFPLFHLIKRRIFLSVCFPSYWTRGNKYLCVFNPGIQRHKVLCAQICHNERTYLYWFNASLLIS